MPRTPTPTMTVASDASMRVKPRAGLAGMKRLYGMWEMSNSGEDEARAYAVANLPVSGRLQTLQA